MAIGVDTGGTFTDVIRRDDDGRLEVFKLLSTPEDPSEAVEDGVRQVQRNEGGHVVHGTTVATNALLEREGANLAFVTTRGFEDLLEIGRQNRPDLYDLEIDKLAPLVDPSDCYGVAERIGPDGTVLEPLDGEQLESVVEEIVGGDYDAVAICLLHAYVDDTHERRVARAFREAAPELHVSSSSRVVPQFREFERASTVCVNAYVAPKTSSYLRRLDERLPVDDIEILQSSGGRDDIEHAAAHPVHTVLSGPAGGVVGARAAAEEVGIDRIVSFDMGGTSTDVSLCDGEVTIRDRAEVEGVPILAPVVDIETVGAGGGSIARIDSGGALRVGPGSAGADPGPVCYGRGGVEPTVTDAHVVLGRIRPGQFLGGRMEVDVEAAERAVGELAEEAGLALEEAARGILEVADAAMVRAIKAISLERGYDPREFCLVAFGGAGALHACRLAESLEMTRVLVPRDPGVLSAYGMLHADIQRIASRTLLEPLADVVEAPAQVGAIVEQLRDEAVGDRPDAEAFDAECVAQLRYSGQSWELDIPVDWAEPGAPSDPTARFEARHEERYGYRAEDRDVELVGLRLTARRPGPTPGEYARGAADPEEVRASRVAEVGFEEGRVDADIVDRRHLEEGEQLSGPAVVTEYTATTVVPPNWRARVRSGHLLVERSPQDRTGGST